MNEPAHARIAQAVERLGTLIRSEENRRAAAEGLSPLQAHALEALARRPGQRLGALARELLVTYGTLSAAVTALEEKGLLTKYADPEEHRAVNLEVTRAGRQAARRVAGWGAELFAGPLEQLGPDRTGALLEPLLELIAALERSGSLGPAGLCLTCRHFRRDVGDGQRRHYCALLERPIGTSDLRVHCPEHEPKLPAPR